jgi:hypothetical protein
MDAGYRIELLNMLDPDWEGRTVDVVTFPAPPVLAKGVMYAEDCWRSDVVERGRELFGKEACRAGVFTDRGPAFVVRYPLAKLFRSFSGDQTAVAEASIYCANISYATLLEVGQRTYATDAILEGVTKVGASCHPASHTSVPDAPWMTLLLQLATASKVRKGLTGFVFADDEEARRYFAGYDFSSNRAVDQLFRFASLQDCLIFRRKHRLEVQPVLSDRMVDRMLPRLESNERLAVRYRDVRAYANAILRRDQLIVKEV